MYASVFWGAVCPWKQAACYSLAPVPPETLGALSEAGKKKMEVEGKTSRGDVCVCFLFLTPAPAQLLGLKRSRVRPSRQVCL